MRSFSFVLAPLVALGLFVSSPASAQTISMPAISQIGAGLQVGSITVILSTSQHGGVTVHIESDNSAIALVSNTMGAIGQPFFDVFVPNGSTNVVMYVHALEDTTGTANITASAPGFTSASRPAVVVVPAVDIFSLGTTLDTLDPIDPFQVRVGLPNAGGTLVAQAQPVRAGQSLTATVTNSNAPVGELETTAVTGQSVTVPILAGASTSPSTVAAGGVAFDGLSVGSTSVSASIPGFTPVTGATQIINVTQPVVTISPIGNVGAGLMNNGNATLSASQHGGILVSIESNNPGAILLSPNTTTVGTDSIAIALPNGTTSVAFFVHGVENVVSGADITVSAPGFDSATRQAVVVQPGVDLTGLLATLDTLDPIDPFQVRVGLPNVGNTAINVPQPVRPGGPGVVATVVSVTGSVGTLVTNAATGDTVQVSILAGASTSPANVASGGVAFDGIAAGTTTLIGQIPGFITTSGAAQVVTVTQPVITMNAISNVGAGLMGSSSSASLSASQHGGVTMRIESADTTLALVSPNTSTAGQRFIDVPLANGVVTAIFVVHGLEDTVGTATVTATAPGFIGANRTVSIVQPAFDIISLATSIDTIDPDDPFQVRIGLPNANQTSVNVAQAVRIGSPGVDVTLVSSNGAVGTLVTTPSTDDTVSVHIAAGSFASPNSVANGGVAFDAVSGGTTTVSADIPDFLPTTGASVLVTVTQPTITMTPHGDVGSGLQGGAASASLSGGQHGGVTVRIESSDPAIALVSPNVSTPGTPFFDTVVPNGGTVVQFVVHGVEDTTGTPNIMASAPAFTSAMTPVNIVEPGVEIISIVTSMDVDDPDDPFAVRVGLKNASGSSLIGAQSVRAGSPGLVATIVSSNGSVGQLETTTLTGDTVLVSIAAGSNSSPATVAAGGVAIDGIAPGNTLVSARIPGFFPTGAATKSVDVIDFVVAMPPIGKVGAGLQSAQITATLGLAGHGGVTVRVESSDPTVALVSPAFATPGSAFFDVFVADNSVNVPFFVQGLEDTVATANITVSTPGFTSAVRLTEIVQPGVQIEQLPDSIDVNEPNDPFIVRVGIPKNDLSEIESPQVIRAGGVPMVATVTSSDPDVGVLVTTPLTGASVTVTIPVGGSQSASDAASGGVEFDPVLGGTTLVSASIPGVAQLTSSTTTCVVTGVPDPTPVSATPVALSLAQNQPNPFNPTTRIRFALPRAAEVNVSVFDVHGRLVTTLLDRSMPAGPSEVLWNGRDARGVQVSSGVYFYRLTAGAESLTKKMVMIK